MITDSYSVAISDLWCAADVARGDGWGAFISFTSLKTQAVLDTRRRSTRTPRHTGTSSSVTKRREVRGGRSNFSSDRNGDGLHSTGANMRLRKGAQYAYRLLADAPQRYQC